MRTLVCLGMAMVASSLGNALAGAEQAAPLADKPAPLVIVEPAEWQVFQREGFRFRESHPHQPGGAQRGFAPVPVRLAAGGPLESCEVRTVLAADCQGAELAWTKLALVRAGEHWVGTINVPAGGWYRLEVRTSGSGGMQTVAIERFGVGEVLLIAGQSYAAGANDELLQVADKPLRVSCCNPASGSWNVAHDPQPGRGDGGTIWPPLGDHLAATLEVPIGLVNVAVGGTSSRQWLPDQALYADLAAAGRRLGQFRAVLWQQGESDVIERTSTEQYVKNLVAIRDGVAREWRFPPPWLLAKSTLHPTVYDLPREETAIRVAIDQLVDHHGFRPGPDTDLLAGENRGGPGTRRHFTGIGQRRAALLWFAAIWQELQR